MTNGDKFKVSLDSKVFDKTGKHIYISRKYASFDKPEPDSENIKLLKFTEGSFDGLKNLSRFSVVISHLSSSSIKYLALIDSI